MKKGKFLLVCIFVCSLMLFGCGAKAPAITPVSATVDLAAVSDVSFSVNNNGEAFVSLLNGEKVVEKEKYTLESTKITFKTDYIFQLGVGTHNFKYETKGGSSEFSLVITDTRTDNPVISSPSGAAFTFDKAQSEDIVFSVDFGKGTFTEIKLGQDALNKADGDYVVNNNEFAISSSFLMFLPSIKNEFTIVSSTGSATFSIDVCDTRSVWTGETAKDFLDSDLSFGLSLKGNAIKSITVDNTPLATENYSIGENAITIKASYLSGLSKAAHSFIITDSLNARFPFSVFVGLKKADTIYFNFENGILPNADNFGVNLDKQVKTGFDGNGANLVSGKDNFGTILSVNRQNFIGEDNLKFSFIEGKTYFFSMQFKINSADYTVTNAEDIFIPIRFGDAKDIVILKADENGIKLPLTQGARCSYAVCNKSVEGVYTLEIKFVPIAGDENFEVALWTKADLTIDNILMYRTNGIPTVSDGNREFDLGDQKDISVSVSLNDNEFVSLKRNNTDLSESDYSFDSISEILTVKKEFLSAFPAGSELTLTIITSGDNVAFNISVIRPEPEFIDKATTKFFGNGENEVVSFYLDTKNFAIKDITANGNLVDSANYSYSKQNTLLTFKNSYLKTVKYNTKYVISFTGTNTIFNFIITSNYIDENFDGDNSGFLNGEGIFSKAGTTVKTEVIGTDAIGGSGKSVKQHEKNEGSFFYIDRLTEGKTYNLAFDFKPLDLTVGADRLWAYIILGEYAENVIYFKRNVDNTLSVEVHECVNSYEFIKLDNGAYHISLSFSVGAPTTDGRVKTSVQLPMSHDVIFDNLKFNEEILSNEDGKRDNDTVITKVNNMPDESGKIGVKYSIDTDYKISKIMVGKEIVSKSFYTVGDGYIDFYKDYIFSLSNKEHKTTIYYEEYKPLDVVLTKLFSENFESGNATMPQFSDGKGAIVSDERKLSGNHSGLYDNTSTGNLVAIGSLMNEQSQYTLTFEMKIIATSATADLGPIQLGSTTLMWIFVDADRNPIFSTDPSHKNERFVDGFVTKCGDYYSLSITFITKEGDFSNNAQNMINSAIWHTNTTIIADNICLVEG